MFPGVGEQPRTKASHSLIATIDSSSSSSHLKNLMRHQVLLALLLLLVFACALTHAEGIT
jgi:hypothetical protein